jgi:hypothetical protein
MRPFTFARIAVAACIALTAAGLVSACSCSDPLHGKTRWELARLEQEGSTVIFEGTPERFELQWSLLKAKEGELIPVESQFEKPGEGPRMLVTFRVQKSYKGDLGTEIQINTGLGGGDCGVVYSPGLTYLVFAGRSIAGGLWVSICSPGGWVESSGVATELRYLRKRHPTAADLVTVWPLTVEQYAAQEKKRHRDYEEFQKRYAAVTGKICGKVTAEKAKDENAGVLSFLSSTGYSPGEHPRVSINPDGSFCSMPLGPGKYYLYFTRGSEEGPTSAVYYPGVSDKNQATVVEANAGQTRSDILFIVPTQKGYSVRGIISTNDKSGLDARSVYVSLVRRDVPSPFPQKTIDFRGLFLLPKTKYFEFENVLPGHYVACVSVLGQGWYTHKEEVTVTTHMKFISLKLVHQK